MIFTFFFVFVAPSKLGLSHYSSLMFSFRLSVFDIPKTSPLSPSRLCLVPWQVEEGLQSLA